MKNLLIITVALFAVIIAFQACSVMKITEEEKQKIVKEYLSSADTGYCSPCNLSAKGNSSNNAIRSSNNGDYLLETTLLQNMSEKYKTNGSYIKISNRYSSDFYDARAIWFDLKRLKGFITEIENATCGKNCDESLVLGLRMYYARYPETSGYTDLRSIDSNYEERHTIFMVPTFDKSGTHFDFDLQSFKLRKDCMPKEIVSEPKLFYAYVPLPRDNLSTRDSLFINPGFIPSLNHGDLLPPPYNITDYSITGAYFLK